MKSVRPYVGALGGLLLCAGNLSAGVYFEPGAHGGFVGRLRAAVVDVSAQGPQLLGRASGLSLRFEGADQGRQGRGELPTGGVSHYATGKDPAKWRMNIPRYSQVRFSEVYQGIDLIYRGDRDQLEFDFELAPRASPSKIRIVFETPIHVDSSGCLRAGSHTLRRPRAWQQHGAIRQPVDVWFRTRGSKRASFLLGAYDRTLPLVIDPLVEFETYLGGSDNEGMTRLVAGRDGAVFLAGTTLSVDFPAALPDDSILNRPVSLRLEDVYVTRLRSDASSQDWGLFIGGTGADILSALSQDTLGNLYLMGATTSANFPVTPGAYHTVIDSSFTDVFLVKIDSSSGHIKSSTFLGVPQRSDLLGSGLLLAVDGAGGAYVGLPVIAPAGFRSTPGALQTSPGNCALIRMNAGLTAQVYATFLPDAGLTAMAVDPAGNIVAGGDQEMQYPSYSNYVRRIDAAGTKVLSLLAVPGGSGIADLQLDSAGNIYVLGNSKSSTFLEVNPIDLAQTTSPAVPSDYAPSPYLLKLSPDGKSLLQATYFRGPEYTASSGFFFWKQRMALQSNGAPCLINIGVYSFVSTPGGLAHDPNNYYPATVACVDDTGGRLKLKSELPVVPGPYLDAAFTPDQSLLLAGVSSAGLRTTPGVLQPWYGGSVDHRRWPPQRTQDSQVGDAFVLRMSLNNPEPKIIYSDADAMVATTGAPANSSLALYGTGFAYGTEVRLNGQALSAVAQSENVIAVKQLDPALWQLGSNRIDVSIPGPGGGTDSHEIRIVNAAPLSVSVSPASVTVGSGETKLVIFAANLTPASILRWNGQPRAASIVSDGSSVSTYHMELILQPAELAKTMSAEITIVNPAPGGGVSFPVLFAVTPVSGSGILFLETPGSVPAGVTITLNDVYPATETISFSGSVFPGNTKAFLDELEVPAQFPPSGGVIITPPKDLMTHAGTHNVYATAPGAKSNVVPLYIVREATLSTGRSVADPTGHYLFVLADKYPSSDLVIYDLLTGRQRSVVTNAISNRTAIAISGDGRFVYLAGWAEYPRIRRYNVEKSSFDRDWSFKTFTSVGPIIVLPGGPDLLAAVVNGSQHVDTAIIDQGQIRPGTAFSSGVDPFSGKLIFATSNRIFSTPGTFLGSACWPWLDYDQSGIVGGSTRGCAVNPPEVIRDRGLMYLTDGTIRLLVGMPVPPNPLYSTPRPPGFVADSSGEKVYQVANQYGTQVTEYTVATGEQRLVASPRLGDRSADSNLRVIQNANGKLVVYTDTAFTILP